jgi:hypothetical protein
MNNFNGQDKRISAFITMVEPIVSQLVRICLQHWGYEISYQADCRVFSVKCSDKQAEFYLDNLLLEIATIDRDQQSLKFDQQLSSFDYFLNKAVALTNSKLTILFQVFNEEELDKAVEKIASMAGAYQRIRIWRPEHKAQQEKQ